MNKELKEQLDRIEQMLSARAEENNILSVEDFVRLTGFSKPTVYGLCYKRKIPHYKQGKLFFKRNEVEKWIFANRIPTQAEAESKAELYCHTH